MASAQDLQEPFDVCDASGAPLGYAKARAEVHRDGDWHRSVHVWVVLDEGPALLFQRRSLDKDTWPGALDVAVGGHLRAGEGVAEALREADEEIGLPVSLAEVTRLGVRRRAHVTSSLADREIQEVFAVRSARTLASLEPSAAEVAELVAVPFAAAVALLRGAEDSAPARLRLAGSAGARDGLVRRAELIPADDGYYERVADALERSQEGRALVPFSIGEGAAPGGR